MFHLLEHKTIQTLMHLPIRSALLSIAFTLALPVGLSAQTIVVETFDSVDNATITDTGVEMANATFTATNTGSAGNYLIVAASVENSAAASATNISSMTFGGNTMTQLGTTANTSAGWTQIFGIATTSLSGSISADFDDDWLVNNGGANFGYAFLSNVDTANPLAGEATFANNSASSPASMSYNNDPQVGDFVFFGAYHNDPSGMPPPTSLSFSPVDAQSGVVNGAGSFTSAFGYDSIDSFTLGYDSSLTFSPDSTRVVMKGVVLNAIPEPSAGLLMLGGLGALLFCRRPHRRP